jgi:UDP-GlcNAc:undecaprenyl-phosphate/decaprenyl-phosphate GlcNAc-1-phosphate transferase
MTLSDLLLLASAFACAFVVSVCATLVVRKGASRLGFVNRPRADRWSRREVALMGGLGIAVATLLTIALARVADVPAGFEEWLLRPEIAAFLVGATFICGLGFFDDLVSFKPSTKMIGQIACASLLIASGLRLQWTGFEVVNVVLTFFWVIGITNAFNLLDNMDGLSAGTGSIASLFCVALFAIDGHLEPAVVAAVLAGTTAGFLVFNFNPASIFMGDSGSLFIGFMLAGLTLIDTRTSGADLFAVVAVPTVLLAIPIFDTSLVTIVRKLSGRSISQGGRDHTSHRLVAIGLSERRAVLLLWGLSASGGAVAIVGIMTQLTLGRLLLPIFCLVLVLLGIYLARVKVYEDATALEEGFAGRVTPLISNLMYKRRVIEVSLDLILVVFAYYASYMLRFEQNLLDENLPTFSKSLPIVVACKMTALFMFGAYRGVWRYTSLSDLVTYVKASVGGSVVSILVLLGLFRFNEFSRSLFVIDALVLFLLLVGSRLSFRLIDTVIRHPSAKGRATIIYGAGDGGQFALREILNNDQLEFSPIGFVDDDTTKHGRKILGYPIFGALADLPRLIGRNGVEVVILSSDKIVPDRWNDLIAMCTERGVELRRLRVRIEAIVDFSGDTPRLDWDGEPLEEDAVHRKHA